MTRVVAQAEYMDPIVEAEVERLVQQIEAAPPPALRPLLGALINVVEEATHHGWEQQIREAIAVLEGEAVARWRGSAPPAD